MDQSVTRPGGIRPGSEGWRLTAHVLVNAHFEPHWDTGPWGYPINRADQAGTLGLFDTTVMLGSLALDVHLTRRQRDDLMHCGATSAE